jgi:pyruvate/2-oxoacid:ferredoxin oxidoreductase beta subunit
MSCYNAGAQRGRSATSIASRAGAVVVAGAALGAVADAASEAAAAALSVDGDAAVAAVSNCHRSVPRYGGRCSSWEL